MNTPTNRSTQGSTHPQTGPRSTEPPTTPQQVHEQVHEGSTRSTRKGSTFVCPPIGGATTHPTEDHHPKPWCIGYRRTPHVPTTGALIEVTQPRSFHLCSNCWTQWSRGDGSPSVLAEVRERETMRRERMDAYSVGRHETAGQTVFLEQPQTERKHDDPGREVQGG